MSLGTVRRVCVIGTGMIGTSVALALRRVNVDVALADLNAEAVAEAERMQAGHALGPGTPPADVVVIATPPSTVVDVLLDAQKRGLGGAYTDVASAKERICAEAEFAGCDMGVFVPGHPMAGRELSGAAAGRADLFTGRPWVLCPHAEAQTAPVRAVAELVKLCGAAPRFFTPDRHDRFVAAVSHVPHLVAAALAARFADADEILLSLAGRGLMDTTRIAAGSQDLWRDILEHNAGPVRAELESVAHELTAATATLRRSEGSALEAFLARGNEGRVRIVRAFEARG
jgi:prephenate dehydrogenase